VTLTEAARDSLDAAWAEAEAVLPGWFVARLILLRLPTRRRPLWEASAVQALADGNGVVSEIADSPAAALRALAEKLREAKS